MPSLGYLWSTPAEMASRHFRTEAYNLRDINIYVVIKTREKTLMEESILSEQSTGHKHRAGENSRH